MGPILNCQNKVWLLSCSNKYGVSKSTNVNRRNYKLNVYVYLNCSFKFKVYIYRISADRYNVVKLPQYMFTE